MITLGKYAPKFSHGDTVDTPFGAGLILNVRNSKLEVFLDESKTIWVFDSVCCAIIETALVRLGKQITNKKNN